MRQFEQLIPLGIDPRSPIAHHVRAGEGVDIIALRAALAHVEKAIVVGEQTIAAQRSLIAEMERSGVDARAQKQALENLKREQWRRIQRREILTQELAAEGC